VPRKKQLAQLPIQIYNLGSAAGSTLSFSREELWARMDASMGAKAVSTPVFLVNEAQMDKIYPPKRRRALDPKKVRARIRDWGGKGIREIEDLFKELDNVNDWEQYEEIVAVGVYVSDHRSYYATQVVNLGDKEYRSEDAEEAFLNLGETTQPTPAIFLCPERIVNWAKREGIPVELVLDKVYYHELGHAIMDVGDTPYDTSWGRTIEESLANWIAYSKFKGSDVRLIQHLIETQPAEYKGYAWLENAFIGLFFESQNFPIREWIDFIWHLRCSFLPWPFLWVTAKEPTLEKLVMESWIESKRRQYWSEDVEKAWQEFAVRLLERV